MNIEYLLFRGQISDQSLFVLTCEKKRREPTLWNWKPRTSSLKLSTKAQTEIVVYSSLFSREICWSSDCSANVNPSSRRTLPLFSLQDHKLSFARAFVINIYIIFIILVSRYSRPFSNAVPPFLLDLMLTPMLCQIITYLFSAIRGIPAIQLMVATCSWNLPITIFYNSKGSLNAGVPSSQLLVRRQRAISQLPRFIHKWKLFTLHLQNSKVKREAKT